jgi:hypothetical protein
MNADDLAISVSVNVSAPLDAETVTTYIVQARLSTGWADASAPLADLQDARRIVRQGIAANVGPHIRIVERRVTTIESVVPA